MRHTRAQKVEKKTYSNSIFYFQIDEIGVVEVRNTNKTMLINKGKLNVKIDKRTVVLLYDIHTKKLLKGSKKKIM